MRKNGTKYDKMEVLPAKAISVSEYAREIAQTSPAYVHVKFDRYKFGALDKKTGKVKHSPRPNYEIVDFKGIAFVIPD
mgnify:CR=1 FL=1